MRIFVALPGAEGAYPPEAERRRVAVIQSYARDNLQIEVGYPAPTGFQPFGGQTAAPGMARNHLAIADRMVQAAREGFDACVSFGMLDFGAEIARARCEIPIIGQAQATYCMAAMMVDRVGVITYRSTSRP